MIADRQMLNDAICGTNLSRVTAPSIVRVKGLGNYTGGFDDRWTWRRDLVANLQDGDAERLYADIRRLLGVAWSKSA